MLVGAGAILAAAVAGGTIGAVTTSTLDSSNAVTTTVVEPGPAADAAPAAATTSGLTVNQVYRKVSAGVVEITVNEVATDAPFGQATPQRALGSGFVYDDQGDIVTNNHVVAGASSIQVTFQDGSVYDARVVGTDPSTDLAVIKVDAPASQLHPLTLGDSGALQVGDQVVAVGSPFGLEDTVTSGIVSALDRRITSPNGFAITNAIQTDAAINHGNSGGPLLDMRGQVVGVTSQIESDSGGNDGIGFAVPSDTVRSVVSQLVQGGEVEHAYLGVSIETIPADAAGQLGEPAGAAVADVRAGSPAADASLHAATGSRTADGIPYPTGGDVITAVDGQQVATAEELQDAIAAKKPGEHVTLTVERAGQTRTVDVELASRPAQ
jgi:S1-C subfamily serine protease